MTKRKTTVKPKALRQEERSKILGETYRMPVEWALSAEAAKAIDELILARIQEAFEQAFFAATDNLVAALQEKSNG